MKTKFLMKASLMGLCLLASMEASAKDFYLAPGGTGNGMTIDKPFGDPIKAFAALKAGDVLYVRGGTYHLSQTIKVNQNALFLISLVNLALHLLKLLLIVE